ncbi:MAG: sugar phosphate isomerase/epimerase family protein [Syntrophaceae bacterium]
MVTIGGRAHTLEAIHAVGKLGYPFAEISLKVPEEVESQLEELLRLKSVYGLYYLAHYPNEDDPFDPRVLKDTFLPRMYRLLDLSESLGIPKGTIHFWIDKRWAPPDLIPAKIELLANMASYARDRGVVLCIENLSERADSFAPAFEAVPDLRMTLDIGHAQLLSRTNTSFEFIERHFDRIAHLHVHDNRGGTSVHDDLHLPLGSGCVDYPQIFRALRLKGYQSTATMELKPEEMPLTRLEILRHLG